MISVIALTHDRDKNLDFAMKSWVNQTYKDFELNIFESGNMDSTLDILRKYKNDVKINCWRLHTKYVNKTYALNFLANNCKGEYLSIWDVDLIKANNYLQTCQDLISEGHFVLEYARYMNGNITNMVFDQQMCFEQIVELEKSWGKLFSHADAPSQLFLYKKDYLAIGGYFEMFFGWGPEDSDFLERLMRSGKQRVISSTWSYHLEHSIKNNYQHTAYSSKRTNQEIYLKNKEDNVIVVDNSTVSWVENQWDEFKKPEKIEL